MELKGVQHITFANEVRAHKRVPNVNIRKRKKKKRNTTPYYNSSSSHTCMLVRSYKNKSMYGS